MRLRPGAEQVLRRRLAACEAVSADRAVAVRPGRDAPDDERRLSLGKRADVPLRAAGGHQDEAVDAAGLEIRAHPVGVVRRDLDDEQVIAVRVETGGDPTHDLEHERVGHGEIRLVLVGDERDDVALLQAEPARRVVHLEPVLPGDLADAVLRLDADQRAVVERARDGGLGHARQAGDVGDGLDGGFLCHQCNRLHAIKTSPARGNRPVGQNRGPDGNPRDPAPAAARVPSRRSGQARRDGGGRGADAGLIPALGRGTKRLHGSAATSPSTSGTASASG